jgi:hypothetical protein
VYLEHLERCTRCCEQVVASAPGRAVEPEATGTTRLDGPFMTTLAPAAEGRLAAWIDQLKRAIPAGPPADNLAIGRKIASFRLVAVLGEGGSSVVYEAVDEELGRRVVLKVLKSIHGADPGRRAMVIDEARALAAMQHDAIMPLLQLVWDEDLPVLVFPRLPGETLATTLATGGLTWRATMELIRDIARGLAHAHGLGICHRDVKPTNIWLQSPNGDAPTKALLFDFGLVGGSGDTSGTPGYCEPESRRATRPELQDMFSLGVVLHECLRQCDDPPPGHRKLVDRLTRGRANERPSAQTVATTIDRMLGPARRHPLPHTVAASLVLLCLLVTGAVAARIGARPVPPGLQAVGALEPETIIEPRGWPVAISRNLGTQASVDAASTLHVRAVPTDMSLASVPLSFRPDWLCFTIEGARVAAANTAGDLAIVDVATATVVSSQHFPRGIAWIGWAGWERDALGILSDGAVHALCGRRRKPSHEDVPDEWILVPIRDGVARVACFPNSEAMLAVDGEGSMTSWSFGGMTGDATIAPTRFVPHDSEETLFGWKIPGVAFVVTGGKAFEFVSPHGPESKNRQLLASPRAIAWVTTTEYVMLSQADPAHGSRLLWGDVQNPDRQRELAAGGDEIDRIELSQNHDRLAGITRRGGIRIYPLIR